MNQLYRKISLFMKIFIFLLYYLCGRGSKLDLSSLKYQLRIVFPNSLFIIVITSFFISLVFSLQILKEFLYLNAVQLIGSILSISFVRELSPVLTSIVIVGRVCSLFTAQLSTMVITEQVDALLVLGINPVNYLIVPRVLSMIISLPLLNIISILTSLVSGSFVSFLLYKIQPTIFFESIFYSYFFSDLLKSLFKTFVFALFISIISCSWGITSIRGSEGVGISTTSSVVMCLISVFVLNFILSYLLFNNLISSFQLY
uniref:ABC transporter permease n=1 Tax=Chondria tumulosa TaxID=2740715 RepID=A0A896SU83_9FLOR|nr:hypothetical protein K8K75_pgp163 [Chondria tumulosa]QSD57044.1 hypothetical protein [Chondria tumulosa]